MKILDAQAEIKGLREGEALLIKKDICMVLEKRDMEFLHRAVERELRNQIEIDKEINPLVRWFINGEEIK